jgi:hypothetical protein
MDSNTRREEMAVVQQQIADGVAAALTTLGVQVTKAEYLCGKLSTFHTLRADADRASTYLQNTGWRWVRVLETYENTWIVTGSC